MSTETLTRLRFSASRLADSICGPARDVAVSMLTEIDSAIKTERSRVIPMPRQAEIKDLSAIPVNELLGEISRRLRSVRKIAKVCNKCGKDRCRANGLCMRCYQRQRKEVRRGSQK